MGKNKSLRKEDGKKRTKKQHFFKKAQQTNCQLETKSKDGLGGMLVNLNNTQKN